MTLQQCKYVLKIQKEGSFSEAAKQLFIAQSGLSNSIKLLEEELKIKIFERSKNGVSLTCDGAEFVRYAEQIVAQSLFILDRYGSKEQKNRLYISTQHYDFIADVFCRFVSEYDTKTYDISLQEKKTHEVIHDVEIALSDIGIIAIKNKDFDIMKRYLQTKEIKFVEFLKTNPHLFVKSSHELARKTSVLYDEITSYPFVCYEQGEYNNSSLFTEEMSSNVLSNKRIIISDRATLMNVLLKTDCFTIGTGIMPSELNDKKIVGIPIVTDETYIVGYITKKNHLNTIMTEKFLSLLTNYSVGLMKNIAL